MLTEQECFRNLLFRPLSINYRDVWDVESTDPNDTIPRWKRIEDESIFHPDDLYTMRVCGLKITLIRVFRWAPNAEYPWHIDGNPVKMTQTQFAINWVLNSIGHIEFNNNVVFPEPSPHDITYRTLARKYDLTKKYISEVTTDSSCCILDTTIPHRVVVNAPQHRLTVSVLFQNEMTYAEAVKRLQIYDVVV